MKTLDEFKREYSVLLNTKFESGEKGDKLRAKAERGAAKIKNAINILILQVTEQSIQRQIADNQKYIEVWDKRFGDPSDTKLKDLYKEWRIIYKYSEKERQIKEMLWILNF